MARPDPGTIITNSANAIAQIQHRAVANRSVRKLSSAWVRSHLPSEQIESALELAVDVFGDQQIAEKWLREPNIATDNMPPIALLGTIEGFTRVKTLLARIEYGVLA